MIKFHDVGEIKVTEITITKLGASGSL